MHSMCSAPRKWHPAQRTQLPLCCYQQTKLVKPSLHPSKARVLQCELLLLSVFDHQIKIFSILHFSLVLQCPAGAKCYFSPHLVLPAGKHQVPQCAAPGAARSPSQLLWALQSPEVRSRKIMVGLCQEGLYGHVPGQENHTTPEFKMLVALRGVQREIHRTMGWFGLEGL